MEITFNNDTEYQAALQRIRQLWGVEEGTPEYLEFDLLFSAAEQYELEHYPVEELDPIEHLKIRLEVLGITSYIS